VKVVKACHMLTVRVIVVDRGGMSTRESWGGAGVLISCVVGAQDLVFDLLQRAVDNLVHEGVVVAQALHHMVNDTVSEWVSSGLRHLHGRHSCGVSGWLVIE
jgi:hypothetical protein